MINKEFEIKNFRVTFLKHKWFILTVILLITGFYWYQIRPAQIKIHCSENAIEILRIILKKYPLDSQTNPLVLEKAQQVQKDGYQSCLHSNGL